MNLKMEDWRIYAILRECDGKKKAEEYKQKCFKRYKKYGLLPQNENNGYNFVKAFGDYDSYTMKCFIPCFFSDAEKEEIREQSKKEPKVAQEHKACVDKEKKAKEEAERKSWHESYYYNPFAALLKK